MASNAMSEEEVEATAVISVTNDKLRNVTTAFNNIQSNGIRHTYSGNSPDANIGVTHVQGIAHYGKFCFLNHSRSDLSYKTGLIGVIKKKTDEALYWFDTPHFPGEKFSHPGGMQVIGDCLMVPVENSDNSACAVVFYDLTTTSKTEQPTRLPYTFRAGSHGAGAAGITSFNGNGGTNYLMAVYDNGQTYFYIANGKRLDDPSFTFTFWFSKLLPKTDYSTLCLLTQKPIAGGSDGLYMVGFRTHDPWGDATDYMDLYKIDLYEKTVSDILVTRHMITQHGGTYDVNGVHFRWAAGLRIESDTSLKAYATQRNFVGAKFSINSFPPT